MTIKVLLDTNFFLDLIRYRNDFSLFENLEERAELFVSSEVVRELKSIANKKTKEGRLALIALELIKNQNNQRSKKPKCNISFLALLNLLLLPQFYSSQNQSYMYYFW